MVTTFVAQRPSRLFGRRYSAGQEAHLVYVLPEPPEHEWLEEHQGRGGPWGWGGFAGRDLRRAYRPATDADWRR